ncbi:MAG: hypothetical protein KDD44_05770, partial [Bdellovibrionales bacterium]|nr:hypothetical protein [Bdellovibrionales bacterium]
EQLPDMRQQIYLPDAVVWGEQVTDIHFVQSQDQAVRSGLPHLTRRYPFYREFRTAWSQLFYRDDALLKRGSKAAQRARDGAEAVRRAADEGSISRIRDQFRDLVLHHRETACAWFTSGFWRWLPFPSREELVQILGESQPSMPTLERHAEPRQNRPPRSEVSAHVQARFSKLLRGD